MCSSPLPHTASTSRRKRSRLSPAEPYGTSSTRAPLQRARQEACRGARKSVCVRVCVCACVHHSMRNQTERGEDHGMEAKRARGHWFEVGGG